MLLNSRIFKALISCILVLSLALSVIIPAFAAEGDEVTTSATAAAEEMMDDFLAVYLRDHLNAEGEVVGKSTYRWSDQYFEGNNEPRETDFWLSAILFDSFNDALEYGDDEEYKEKIKEVMYGLYESFAKSEYHPTWDVDTWEINTYNDDLCWWAMALERAYELTGVEEYLTLAEECISRVLLDYDTTDAFGGEPLGGILWRWSEALATNRNSKDMCANGNTSLVCSRFAMLYAAKGDQEKADFYAQYAKNTYNWLKAHLYVEGGNGRVNNSVNYDGSVNTAQYTYNYGVCAGAAYELYNLTGEQSYLDTAIEVMQYGFDTLTSDGLTIADEGTGDGSGFKNIMLRIAADMCYNGGVEQFDKYITANAYQAWNHRREADGLVGSNLRFTPLDEERLCSPCAILGPSLLYWSEFDPNGEYNFDFSGNDVEGRYEAELARSSNMTYSSNQDGATPQSGKSFTWYWNPNNNVEGWIEFEVDAPSSGKYYLDMSWYTRGNNNRRLSVNGGESVLINFNRQQSRVWEIETFEIELTKGMNKIRVSYPVPRDSGSDPWLFLDYIELRKVPSESAAAEEMLDAWMEVFLADRTTEDGSVVGLTSWRWSDKWQERQMDVESGEPRETDFWLSGIVFESFNDALEYGDDIGYKEKIKEVMYGLYEGFAKSGWHPNWDVHVWQDNTYNDDLCWWSMAMLRAYQLTGEEEYFDLSKQLLDKLLTDYDTTEAFGGEPYGGILWRRSEAIATTSNSKDACANGNAGLLSYRFAQHYAELAAATEDEALKAEYEALEANYADYGDAIYNWTMSHLYKGDGYVINSINYNGRENTAQFTYNYGVIAGSAYERYNYYGNEEDLERATEIMDSAFERFVQGDGLTIKDEGTGDSAGFKTIMLRIAADMYRNGDAPQYQKYLEANALQAWRHRRESDGLVGSNLRFTPREERLCSPCAILGSSLLYWADFDPEADYDYDFSGSDVAGRYEAEMAYINGCATTSTQVDGYSGTGHIQYWNSGSGNRNDGYIEFEIEVEETDTYMLNLHWYTRGNNTRRMSVNGGEDQLVQFTRTTANVWENVTVNVDLEAGMNIIRFTYYNPTNHEDADSDPWLFLDYIDVKSTSAAADKTEYEVGETITFTVKTDANVTRVGIANENGKLLGKKSQSIVENEDGTLTWTITTSIATKGVREVSIYMDNGDGVLFDTGKTIGLVITEATPAVSDDATMTSAALNTDVAKKNEVITATVVTGTGVSKIGIFSEAGKAMGKISESYVDDGDVRTWTVTFKIGSRGDRNLTIKAADAAGAWVSEAPVAIKIK